MPLGTCCIYVFFMGRGEAGGFVTSDLGLGLLVNSESKEEHLPEFEQQVLALFTNRCYYFGKTGKNLSALVKFLTSVKDRVRCCRGRNSNSQVH